MSRIFSLFLAFFIVPCAYAQTQTQGRGPTLAPAPAPEPGHLKEAWDEQNAPSLIGLHTMHYDELTTQAARRGTLPQKPWKDSYWPYYKKNIANRYIDQIEFPTFAAQQTDAQGNQTSLLLSPAEKYDILNNDPSMAVTAESWARYDQHHAIYGDDFDKWSWMGICNGWAPAALNETAPQSPVVISNSEGKDLVFFNGDLRALLSKAYDINKMTETYRMVGQRCDDTFEKVPRDATGRPMDGQITDGEKPFSILHDYLFTVGAMEVANSATTSDTYWLMTDKPLTRREGDFTVWRYTSRADVVADLAANTRGQHATASNVAIHFFKNCRDVNASTLHLAFAQMLSDAAPQKTGFIAELSRNEEVWNYPIWGFDTVLAAPRPLGEEALEKRVFRAPSTAYLVDVTTRLIYVNGAQPDIVHPEDDTQKPVNWNDLESTGNRYAILTLHYSLEFDASGLLVGGEWLEDPDDHPFIPDFFWRTYGTLTDDSASAAGPSVLKYSLLKKLLACSQQPPNTTVDTHTSGIPGPLAAVRCVL